MKFSCNFRCTATYLSLWAFWRKKESRNILERPSLSGQGGNLCLQGEIHLHFYPRILCSSLSKVGPQHEETNRKTRKVVIQYLIGQIARRGAGEDCTCTLYNVHSSVTNVDKIGCICQSTLPVGNWSRKNVHSLHCTCTIFTSHSSLYCILFSESCCFLRNPEAHFKPVCIPFF